MAAIPERFTEFLPTTLTVVRPYHAVVPRGRWSQNTKQPTVTVRLAEDERKNVDQAADLLDLSRSEFIRWCADQVAQQILRYHEEFVKAHRLRR